MLCRSGVFNDANCVPNNAHAMNVVGYGTLNCTDYWVNSLVSRKEKFYPVLKNVFKNSFLNKVVRNSWGTGWGASGYILVKRGVDLCQIESLARTTNIAWIKKIIFKMCIQILVFTFHIRLIVSSVLRQIQLSVISNTISTYHFKLVKSKTSLRYEQLLINLFLVPFC